MKLLDLICCDYWYCAAINEHRTKIIANIMRYLDPFLCLVLTRFGPILNQQNY